MRTTITFLPIWLGVAFHTLDADPGEYYQLDPSKPLREELHDLIDSHISIPYSSSSFDSADAMSIMDADPGNTSNVILVYSRRSEAISNFAGSNGWNREHLWPNSYGIDRGMPAYSDLHNLQPCDMNVNSRRGNLIYDNSDPQDSSYVSPATSEAPLTSKDSDSWEPPDEMKGNVARAAFYMDIRYSGDVSNEPDLILTDDLSLISSTSYYFGNLATLLQWHAEDPPDDAEKQRNDSVQGYQGNRNPFIDFPEYAGQIFGSQEPSEPSQPDLTWAWMANYPCIYSGGTWYCMWPVDGKNFLYNYDTGQWILMKGQNSG